MANVKKLNFSLIVFISLSLRISTAQNYGNRYSPTFLMNNNDDIEDIEVFLKEYNREASEMCNRVATNEWRFATNATDYNKRRMNEQQSVAAKFECLSWKRASAFTNIQQIADTNVKRQLNRIVRQGKCGLGDERYTEIQQLITIMKDVYNKAKICPYRGEPLSSISPPMSTSYNRNNPFGQQQQQSANYVTTYTSYCDLKLEPDLIRLMELSHNEPELRYVWHEWREKIGPPIKNSFMRYVMLANQAAIVHGFHDAGEQMRSVYEDDDFFFTVQDLWTKIQPLYKQLFTFVRKGLIKRYGNGVLRTDGPIPAHLLGNMWSQNWRNILDLIKPGGSESPDVTGEMIKQGYTPLKMFQMAEEFFTSMGMSPMSPEFWRNSMLQRPSDIHVQCTASAWDFCNNIDYRIKQCTETTLEDYINSHHEMTHIQYYMQYTGQPFIYREGPNPAFHEAVAHAIGLCVSGPVHLQHVGLISSLLPATSGNSIINIEYLLGLALDKLPFMAYSIALEKWRWYIFEKGPIGMNAKWWEIKLRYQGIIPPDVRSSRGNFDAAAKYHIISDQDYIKYFIATILQFQIYLELCVAANHVGPLHTCDFHRSREAGRLLSEIMQHGASITTAQLMKILTRGKTDRISADPLLEFFRPLESWLEQQNRNEPVIGWNSDMNDVALFEASTMNNSGGRDDKHYWLNLNFLFLIITILII